MIYKLPKEKRHLSNEIKDKIAKLTPEKQNEWNSKFDDCKPDKNLYDSLQNDIRNGNIQSNTVQDIKYLEEKITKKENELMLMLSDQPDRSNTKISEDRAALLTGGGIVNIRPSKGTYATPNPRKKI